MSREDVRRDARGTCARAVSALLLLIYAFLVLWYTVLGRGPGWNVSHDTLFWSYGAWLAGDRNLGLEILGNVAMFVPMGFFLSALPKRRSFLITFLTALCFSALIESLQRITMRGTFELDDIFHNTLGAVIGCGVYRAGGGKLPPWLGAAAVLGLGAVILFAPHEARNIPRAMCLQVNETGEGFAFRPQYTTPEGYMLLLKNTATGETGAAEAEYGLESAEAGAYFGDAYARSGFRLSLPEDGAEYELMVRFNPLLVIPSGVYVSPSGIRYAPEAGFAAPELTAPFVTHGTLRVYRPDVHCWVYQYEGALYWIVDGDFDFEEDGSTYIQYQLYTTQPDRLPARRIKKGWNWDNIGGAFESYELDGDFGTYRVMKRELPTAYPITSITTGYYKNGKWLWSAHFRPYYDDALLRGP